MRPRRRCLGCVPFAIALLALASIAAGDEGPAPAGDPLPAPGRLAPAPIELESDAGALLRDRPRPRAEVSPWGWQLVAFLAALAAAVAVLRGLTVPRHASFPSAAVSLLGTLPLGGQHALRVVRFGRRTLLVGVSPAGCQVLAETDEPLTAPLARPVEGVPLPPAPPAVLAAPAPAPSGSGARGAA